MQTFSLNPGSRFTLNGESWTIHSTQTREDRSVVITRKKTHSEEYVTASLEQLLSDYNDGNLQGIAFGADGSTAVENGVRNPELSAAAKALVHLKKQYLKAVMDEDGNLISDEKSRERKIKKAFVAGKEARKIIGTDLQEGKGTKQKQTGYERFIRYEKCPCGRTVKNWYDTWISCNREDYGLLPNLGNIQIRSCKTDAALIEKLKELIDKKRKRREKWCMSDLHAEIPEVSYSTVNRTVHAYVNKFELNLAEIGYFRAKNKIPSGLPRPLPDSILVEVESDHHQLDVLVVDLKEKIILGVAIITLIIDVKSGIIFGRYISFKKNKNAVLKAIRHAIQPKSDPRWKFGTFLNFHCDNSDGYSIVGLTPNLMDLGAEPTNMRKKHGNDKPRVERCGGALNKFVCHKIKGTTFSNYLNAEDYKSEKYAFVTLEELTDPIDEYILTIHNEGRNKLSKKSRTAVWNADPLSKHIRLPLSVQEVEILTMERTERTIQRDGIELHNMLYDYGDLMELRYRYGIKATLQVRYDEDQMQHIWVKHDQDTSWTKVRAHNSAYHIENYSLTLHRALAKVALQEGITLDELLENKRKLNQAIEDLNNKSGPRARARASGISSESPDGKKPSDVGRDVWDMGVFDGVREEKSE